MEILIPRKLTNELLHLAQLSPDSEICGLVGARQDLPTSCYPIQNISAEPRRRYQLDPKQQIAAMGKMRDQGETLFAVYHSHPKAPAVPSVYDLEGASYPEALYLIISLNIKGVLEMRGFHIRHQQADEVVLRMQE